MNEAGSLALTPGAKVFTYRAGILGIADASWGGGSQHQAESPGFPEFRAIIHRKRRTWRHPRASLANGLKTNQDCWNQGLASF
jgi:hypothetical protein